MTTYVRLTDDIGTSGTATCAVHEVAATIRPWYAGAPAEVLTAVEDLGLELLSHHVSARACDLLTYLGLSLIWDVARPCSITGCSRPHVAAGMCQQHYDRSRRPIPAPRPERLTRDRAIEAARVRGCTLTELAALTGLSTQRVGQILTERAAA